ncbi:hypothetical protein ABKN59_010375 [Abortiporus biennis]
MMPINRIPDELLSKVFTDVVKTAKKSRSNTLVALTHICRRWRQILLNAHSLWAQVHENVKDIDRSLVFLERAQKASLHIYLSEKPERGQNVDLDLVERWGILLNDNAHRIATLDVSMPYKTMERFMTTLIKPFPNVEAVRLDFIPEDQDERKEVIPLPFPPSLLRPNFDPTHLSVKCIIHPFLGLQPTIIPSRLTRLEISDQYGPGITPPGIDQFLDLLAQFSRLTFLRIARAGPIFGPDDASRLSRAARKVRFPVLEELHLDTNPWQVGLYLVSFILPKCKIYNIIATGEMDDEEDNNSFEFSDLFPADDVCCRHILNTTDKIQVKYRDGEDEDWQAYDCSYETIVTAQSPDGGDLTFHLRYEKHDEISDVIASTQLVMKELCKVFPSGSLRSLDLSADFWQWEDGLNSLLQYYNNLEDLLLDQYSGITEESSLIVTLFKILTKKKTALPMLEKLTLSRFWMDEDFGKVLVGWLNMRRKGKAKKLQKLRIVKPEWTGDDDELCWRSKVEKLVETFEAEEDDAEEDEDDGDDNGESGEE